MNLFYYTDPSGLKNFGDDLNPLFWQKQLTLPFNEIDKDLTLVGIGTLLNNTHQQLKENKTILVCGAGVGYGSGLPQVNDNWNIYCVRGPLSAKALGLKKELGIIDPAILISEIYPSTQKKEYEYSYMPHAIQMNDGWLEIGKKANINIIDARKPVEEVVDEIARSNVLLTEAMHGAIAAEAYRVPWVAIKTNPIINEFKWNDWCTSIELNYKPMSLTQVWPAKDNSFFVQAKNKIKQKIVIDQLNKIRKTCFPILSKNSIFEDRKNRFKEKINQLNNDLINKRFNEH